MVMGKYIKFLLTGIRNRYPTKILMPLYNHFAKYLVFYEINDVQYNPTIKLITHRSFQLFINPDIISIEVG